MTPITIFTGFLGAGKTTIINNLIDHLTKKGEKPAYIKNELGEADLDTKIIQGNNIKTKELLNGCVCCTMVGPLIDSLNELITTYQPTRIILESSGTADPVSLAAGVKQSDQVYRDGIITIIDCLNFDGYGPVNAVMKLQAKMTDLIVLNKTEHVSSERLGKVKNLVRQINTYSPIVEAKHEQLDPAVAFGITNKTMLLPQNHQPHSHYVEAVHFSSQKPISKQKLETLIQTLPDSVIRIKGILQTKDSTEIINTIYKRTTYQPYDGADNETSLIILGVKIEAFKEALIEKLIACQV